MKGQKAKRIFSKPKAQARELSKAMFNCNRIASLGTSFSYESSLRLAAEWLHASGRGCLFDLTPKSAKIYLYERAKFVGQKTLDRDRQALQAVLRQSGKLSEKQRLTLARADKQQKLISRNYTVDQVQRIISCQNDRNALSTELAVVAGLRAHELLTLLPAIERPMSDRPADPKKFRDGGTIYTVVGKGGLIREVSIPKYLVERLEATRQDKAICRIDRKINYQCHYDIAGGQSWSQSFSQASQKALGFSNGAHGLRHSYAQARNFEVQASLGSVHRAKQIVSQELGHFRPEITDTYLR